MGGAQRYVFELASRLPKNTYEVAVAFGGQGILKDKLEANGIQTFEIKSFKRDINIVKEFTAMQEIRSIIASFDPEILHLNSSKAGGTGAFIGRIAGIPKIIFTAHGWPFYENRNIFWRTITWFFSYLTTLLSHKVIVVSKHDYDKHMMPLLSSKITTINTAVPVIPFKERFDARTDLFSEDIRAKNKNNIWAVSTGEMTLNKNLLTLLKAVKKANERSVQKVFLTLIGDGEDRSNLEQYVAENNLSEHVLFLGFIDDARVYLKAFDIFLLPSLKEGLPYGLLEAGAAGLYCIASHIGGVPDVVEDGISGVLINPKRVETLTDALLEIPYDIEKAGGNLKKKIESEFSFEKMLTKTISVYESK